MKYQHLVSLALVAALLLTGCGGPQSRPSAAADQSSDHSRSTPGAVARADQTDRITDQYTLEKNVSGVWGEEAVQCISVHVPQLECDSPDAACINGFARCPGGTAHFCCFAKAKSFPQKISIHSVNVPQFFHKLKTPWKVCKSPAAAPVFRVELNSFHRVFNNSFPHILAKVLQFVKFKSEL